ADYSVKITHIKSSIIEDGIGIVKIDGFRVYNTLGDTANDAVYSKDNEANPTFIELRDSVLQVGLNATKDNSAQYASQIASEVMSQVYDKGNANVGLVLSSSLTNTDESKVTDLIDNGPKNEIYLRKGESLVFSTNGSNVQIGLKALNASTTYSINGADKGTISSSTDMFYSVDSEAVTITNTGDGILAVTKLKVFGASQETVLNAVSTEQLTRALVAMGYAADETEPEVTYADAALTVSVNDANGKQLALTVLTANGVEGETHTFTAAEIQSAVKGLTLPSGYILNAVTYKDVTVVYGSEGSVSFKASKAVVDKPSKPAAPTKPSGGTINKIFTSIRNLLKKFF
ncbi:MAG: hypothetical protein SOZ97_05370, partial [Lachnospiraceae bacterium]|nr:hypothetical protein [Lachnospiraceae bacterium]